MHAKDVEPLVVLAFALHGLLPFASGITCRSMVHCNALPMPVPIAGHFVHVAKLSLPILVKQVLALASLQMIQLSAIAFEQQVVPVSASMNTLFPA